MSSEDLPTEAGDPNKHVRLMADYKSFPVWYSGGDLVGEVDPKVLGISDALRQYLQKWVAWFDSTLDWDDPGHSWPEQDRANFDREGMRLWRRLRQEIGHTWRVDYQGGGKIWTLNGQDEVGTVKTWPSRADVEEIARIARAKSNGETSAR